MLFCTGALLCLPLVGVTSANAAVYLRPLHVVGDSISFMTAPAVDEALRGTAWRDVDVHGVPGIRMAGQLPYIESQLAKPTNWVIELGTNDALGNNPNWAGDFANEVNALAAERCVVLVTVGITPPLEPMADQINASIYSAATTHEDFHVLDSSVIYTNPALIGADQVHPTSAGEQELALLIKDAVRSDCGP